MADLERIYLELPTRLQHVGCSAVGLRTELRRYGPPFGRILREAVDRTYWTTEQLAEYRDRRLQGFVRHAAETVPYYRRQFRALGISPEDIRGLDDLARLPVLEKEDVQEHTDEFVSEAVAGRHRIVMHTSGTTGGGLRFARTMRATQEQWAICWRYRHWHGIHRGTWCALFAGRSIVPIAQTEPPFWRYNLPGRQLLFSSYHMSRRTLTAYVAELRRRRPPWLHGYPSSLALIAGHLLDTGGDLGYEVRWVTTSSENLTSHNAHLLERAFGVRPRQHYGMAEAVANISECERGALHVDEDFASHEFVPNTEGDGWRVIGTNMTNPATPLLRYDVGDQVTLTETTCSCGRGGRLVDSIDGRLEDYVILRTGARLGRLDHILKDMVNVREAQIRQRRAGEIVFRVVRGERYTDADEAELLRETHKRVGTDTDVLFEYVSEIERSKNGKLRFVVSEIAAEPGIQHTLQPHG